MAGTEWAPDNVPAGSRLKVLDGGVLLLQEKDSGMFHFSS
jgi:hypothetical protein